MKVLWELEEIKGVQPQPRRKCSLPLTVVIKSELEKSGTTNELQYTRSQLVSVETLEASHTCTARGWVGTRAAVVPAVVVPS